MAIGGCNFTLPAWGLVTRHFVARGSQLWLEERDDLYSYSPSSSAVSNRVADNLSLEDDDQPDDPLRVARKAETVLRGRTERVLLVLEDCADDLNHLAVLRTCEALGVLRV